MMKIYSAFVSFLLSLVVSASPFSQLNQIFDTIRKVDDPVVQANLLRGTLTGLSGAREVEAPASWSSLRLKLSRSKNDEIIKLVSQLSQIFGDRSISEDALKLLLNKSASIADRREALTGLIAMRFQELPPKLEFLLETELQVDAIRAYSFFEYPQAPTELLSAYSKFNTEAKRVTVDTLASRLSYAKELLGALKEGKIEKSDIPTYTARSLQSILGSSFVKAYGKVSEVGEGKDRMIAKYRQKILAADFAKADVSQGRVVYQQVCGACHIMYGEGGKIGPELTGSNRANLDYFLLNVLAPSYDVPEGYRMVTVTSRDGQVFVGNVVEEDASKVVLNMVGQKTVVAKSDIKSRQTSRVSMMPEGLLNPLQDKQILDLIAYMRTEQQVPLP
jgi:putative heme-binding domain-containing protein